MTPTGSRHSCSPSPVVASAIIDAAGRSAVPTSSPGTLTDRAGHRRPIGMRSISSGHTPHSRSCSECCRSRRPRSWCSASCTGCPVERVAALVSRSPGNVRILQHRALKQLRAAWHPRCSSIQQGLCESDDVGDGTRIWAFAHVLAGARHRARLQHRRSRLHRGRARIGDRVTVKNAVLIWDRVTVDDDVFLGPNTVFTNDLRPRSFGSKDPATFTPTRVRTGATIGANTTIVCGVTVGESRVRGGRCPRAPRRASPHAGRRQPRTGRRMGVQMRTSPRRGPGVCVRRALHTRRYLRSRTFRGNFAR